MQRKIVKAKLKNDDTVDVEFVEIIDDEGQQDEVIKKCSAVAHPDLVAAFKDLDIHLATACEQGEFTDYEDNRDKLDIYTTTQISIGGEDEHEGVTITGQRRLAGNKVLNLNAPFIKLNPDHSDYRYAGSLDLAVQHLLNEVDQYLAGKVQPTNQLGLFDQLEEAIDAGPAPDEEEKPKRKVRKMKLAGLDVEVSTGSASAM